MFTKTATGESNTSSFQFFGVNATTLEENGFPANTTLAAAANSKYTTKVSFGAIVKGSRKVVSAGDYDESE
jgi:hypothetical protein